MPRVSRQYVVGDRLWEDGLHRNDKWTAGRIVSIAESEEESQHIYMMLRSDEGRYTLYTTLKNCECKPHLSRFVPGDVLQSLMETSFSVELNPEAEEITSKVQKSKQPKLPKKAAMEFVMESPVFPDVDDEEDLDDPDDDQAEEEQDEESIDEPSVPSIDSSRILPAISLTVDVA